MHRAGIVILAGGICLAAEAVAYAQVDPPIAPFVADARATLARFKEDPAVAGAIGVAAANLPTRGLGFVVGLHLYPIRRGGFAIGVGGEFLRARDTRTAEPATTGGPEGPTVETRFESLSPQLSLNFGRRNGWSYISGGLGRSTFTAERVDRPLGDGPRTRTLNYGGGARWFTNSHLAVSVDLRFYSVDPQPAEGLTRPAFPKTRMMVISGGLAIH